MISSRLHGCIFHTRGPARMKFQGNHPLPPPIFQFLPISTVLITARQFIFPVQGLSGDSCTALTSLSVSDSLTLHSLLFFFILPSYTLILQLLALCYNFTFLSVVAGCIYTREKLYKYHTLKPKPNIQPLIA